MVKAQQEFTVKTRPELEKQLAALDQLRDKQLALQLDDAPKTLAKKTEIEKDFAAYKGWIHDTMETEPQPFLQVVAVVCGVEG